MTLVGTVSDTLTGTVGRRFWKDVCLFEIDTNTSYILMFLPLGVYPFFRELVLC